MTIKIAHQINQLFAPWILQFKVNTNILVTIEGKPKNYRKVFDKNNKGVIAKSFIL